MKNVKKKVKSYAIFGVGKFGRSVAAELSDAGMDVMCIDRNPEKVSAVADFVTMAAVGDVSDVTQMENYGLSDLDAAVVATTGNLSASVMCIMICKEAGVPYIIAKASDEMQAQIFEKLGADKVIIPENESAVRVAHTLLRHDFLSVYELSDDILMVELENRPEWVNKTLIELDLRRKTGLNVAALRINGVLNTNWPSDKPLPKGAGIIVIADRKSLEKLN